MLAPPLDKIIDVALAEDLTHGDVTTDNLIDPGLTAVAHINTRHSTVISGLAVAQSVFHQVDPDLAVTLHLDDGEPAPPKTRLMTVAGRLSSILKAERTALNFLQHLSGIATLTFQYVGVVSQTGAKILHTRKTVPGLRDLEIQAVIHGGGMPHRRHLGEAVLVKDNHLTAAGGIGPAVARLRSQLGDEVRIQVECDTLEQVDEALKAGVDVILLDNMDLQTLQAAVNRAKGKAVLEASGGVTLRNVIEIAKTGVDYISTSQLTMSAMAADIGLDLVEVRR